MIEFVNFNTPSQLFCTVSMSFSFFEINCPIKLCNLDVERLNIVWRININVCKCPFNKHVDGFLQFSGGELL